MLNLQQKKAAEADFFGALETAGLLELALRIRRDEPLARKTTMRVGGSADLYIEPCGLMEIASLVKAARKAGLPYFIKGNGSNIVVSDLGIEGLVVDLGILSPRHGPSRIRIRVKVSFSMRLPEPCFPKLHTGQPKRGMTEHGLPPGSPAVSAVLST